MAIIDPMPPWEPPCIIGIDDPSWGKLKIRVKSGHKAASNGSGCGLSGSGRSTMLRENLPKGGYALGDRG